ncbi:MAG: DNA polymerase Y family protein [Gammaproteobacteria bacterium]|nr:DNA polymerase Y family protein [Gammaproteobacteria bacterium]
MLWLCIHLPALPLEVFERGGEDGVIPAMAVGGAGPRAEVLVCNQAARGHGVGPGMAAGDARARVAPGGGLRVFQRDERAEGQALLGIAAWAMQFTPEVSLAPPDDVLLEVQGSLGLFGGAEALARRVREGMGKLGFRPVLGLGPTPLLATFLARDGGPAPATTKTPAAALGLLPLEVLGLSGRELGLLEGLGIATVGGLLRLPRAGLARRLGPALVSLLDRALGRAPDPRPRFEPPARFETRLDLPEEVHTLEALLFVARRMLFELHGFLAARRAGVRRLTWRLAHGRGQDTPIHSTAIHPTVIEMGLLAPSRDPEHLLALFQERLNGLSLRAPVRGLVIRTEAIAPLAEIPLGLWPLDQGPRGPEEGPVRLIERLRAALGSPPWRVCARSPTIAPSGPGILARRQSASPLPPWVARPGIRTGFCRCGC